MVTMLGGGWPRVRTARAGFCRWLIAALLLVLLHAASAAEILPPPSTFVPEVAQPLPSVHVHQLFMASTSVFSGDSPETDEDFEEIAKLGVKVLISVDGARPEVEKARRHGLRYVHLPLGYDGVPARRVAELVQSARTAEGPIYVHCHHGKHRGPAAVAVLCQATARWTTNQAVRWLRQAGTSEDYPGLFRSVMEFNLPDAAALSRVGKLPEVADTSSRVDLMVAIDLEFDRLRTVRDAAWAPGPRKAGPVPAGSAGILVEHLRLLAQLEDTRGREAAYRALVSAAADAASRLHAGLKEPGLADAGRDAAFDALAKTCVDCHRRYRN